MIAIIADDFSGAAELAGIAAARGFKAEVQTQFDPTSDAEVIAVDTDTRLKSESEAALIVGEVTRQILAAKPTWIYKKTDSVLRGHIRVEIEAILEATGQRDCLYIPANPSKGRIINGGRYFVNDVPLNETVFAHDPDHPCRTAVVRELIGDSERIRTPNAITLHDLIHPIDAGTLAAGAADFFARSIAFLGGGHREVTTHPTKDQTPMLLLCGSLAAWDSGRADEMKKRGFVVQTIDQLISPSIWQQTQKLMLAIGHPQSADTAILTERLIEIALPLIEGQNNLRIGLEGGATAMAFIRRMGWTRFEVIPEGHTGVGTLLPLGGPILCVKPGSYPWPEGCFECQD
jgi:uncharacterized protein YgbK (DUF1537 family)